MLFRSDLCWLPGDVKSHVNVVKDTLQHAVGGWAVVLSNLHTTVALQQHLVKMQKWWLELDRLLDKKLRYRATRLAVSQGH